MVQPDDLKIPERFEHLRTLISSERFLTMQGLGNEVPFFICPYAPDEAVAMQKMVHQLERRLIGDGVRILTIDLYDLATEILKKRGIWDRILQAESQVAKDQLLELLQNVLDPETHLVPAMAEKMAQSPCDVLFITGVGEVYPYIRSHNVLNNLQSTAKSFPTVMFFPGKYTHSLAAGASLELFGLLHDDKYYRAFNIYHIEVSA